MKADIKIVSFTEEELKAKTILEVSDETVINMGRKAMQRFMYESIQAAQKHLIKDKTLTEIETKLTSIEPEIK